MQEIIQSTSGLLEQLNEFVHQFNASHFTKPLKVFSGSSVGMHTRHILEFYQCLLNASNVVNYDLRLRDKRMENETDYTAQIIQDIKLQLIELSDDYSLQLAIGINEHHSRSEVKTCISRELIYLLEHTIHHMAILKMGCIVSFPHIAVHENFGVAFSTIKHQQHVHPDLLTNG
jgi:hypothetical protein